MTHALFTAAMFLTAVVGIGLLAAFLGYVRDQLNGRGH